MALPQRSDGGFRRADGGAKRADSGTACCCDNDLVGPVRRCATGALLFANHPITGTPGAVASLPGFCPATTEYWKGFTFPYTGDCWYIDPADCRAPIDTDISPAYWAGCCWTNCSCTTLLP